MAIERNITADDKWFTGTDKRLVMTVFASDGVTPEDVATWAMSWMVKKNRKVADADALIAKTTAAGSLTITGTYNVDPATNTQRVRCSVSDEDLQAGEIKAGKEYYHELKRTVVGSEEVLIHGTLIFLQAVHVD